jgi:hypothetical protein
MAPHRPRLPAHATPRQALRSTNVIFESGSVPHQIPKDDLVFWKNMGRTVIIGLFLTAVFTIGLYQLLNHN